jgi:hypothetical protein
MCERKVAVRSRLRQKLGKSLSASSCDVLSNFTALLRCSRSRILTNVGSWLNSKRIYWRSPRCRLRRRPSKDKVDPCRFHMSCSLHLYMNHPFKSDA